MPPVKARHCIDSTALNIDALLQNFYRSINARVRAPPRSILISCNMVTGTTVSTCAPYLPAQDPHQTMQTVYMKSVAACPSVYYVLQDPHASLNYCA